jgi:hypothetical protein
VGLVYDPRGSAMSNDRHARSDWGVTNGIRADPHDFTGSYGSVENGTIAYESGTWVRTMTRGSFGRDTIWYACC